MAAAEEKTFTFIVSEDEAGMRLDRYLAQILPDYSRTFIQKLINSGKVAIGERQPKQSHVIETDEVVNLTIPPPESCIPQPEPIPLDIVFEDDALIVLNKPCGMVVHPGAGNPTGTLVNALLHHCSFLSGIGGVRRPGIVHRLDKNTTGLLVVAKTDIAHRHLAAQLSDRSLKRYYLALVAGNFEQNAGTIDAPIGRDERHRDRMAVNPRHGRPAVTHYEVLKRAHGLTLLGVSLETGRTHQIRVHLSHIAHPVVGDPEYGKEINVVLSAVSDVQPLLPGKLKKVKTQLLHAARLQLNHPVSGEPMKFEAPAPPHFLEIINLL